MGLNTAADKNYSFKIEPARRQWSGNAQRVIQGIGIVTMVYVNPDVDYRDYRIYDPHRDSKSKMTIYLRCYAMRVLAKTFPTTVAYVMLGGLHWKRKLTLENAEEFM